jgi:hypothetical protein
MTMSPKVVLLNVYMLIKHYKLQKYSCQLLEKCVWKNVLCIKSLKL